MADNVQLPITGTGTADIVQATDDVSSVHYPIVKLADGTANSSTVIPGGADGLYVQQRAHTQSSAQTATWDSGTAANTALGLDVSKYASASLLLTRNADPISDGIVEFFASNDGGSTWDYVGGVVASGVNYPSADLTTRLRPVTFLALNDLTDDASLLITFGVGSYTNLRVELTQAITDTGTIALRLIADTAPPPAVIVALSETSNGTAAAALRVTIASDSTGTVAVTQGTAANLNMTEASAADIKTAVQLIDDIVYTDDTSTHSTGSSKGALMMAAATPTDAAVNANDIGAVAMTTDRKLHVSVQDALPAGTNAIGKLAANSGVDIGDVDITSIAAGDNNIGNVDIVTMPNGAFAGTVAHDGNTANNPVTVGGRAVAHGSNPTAVAAGDVTDSYYNRAGVQFVIGGHPNIITRSDSLSSATSNAALVTVSSGTKIVVTQMQVVLGTDVSTTPSVLIGFGTANTPAIGNAGLVITHPAMAGGGGVSRGDGSGILAIGADGEDLRYTTGTITGGSMYATYSYYTIES